jgi:hypothetical protein
MQIGMKSTLFAGAMLATGLIAGPARATLLLEYDAATAGAGVEPNDVGWGVSTNDPPAMINNGTFLLQDKTGVSGQQYGEYLSPALGAGTFTRGGPAYGIEFRTRPLTDVAFVGSDYGQMYLSWSDDQFNYNVTVDKHSAGNSSGTGDIVYGQGSFSPAITGIDWSTPHTIFIGYRAGDRFDFFLDGVLQSTVVEGSIARNRAGWEFATDKIDFGDGTTANNDVAGEWYFVRVYDVNAPIPEPASLSLLLGAGLFGLSRRRSRVS